jgi:hypothetical protein
MKTGWTANTAHRAKFIRQARLNRTQPKTCRHVAFWTQARQPRIQFCSRRFSIGSELSDVTMSIAIDGIGATLFEVIRLVPSRWPASLDRFRLSPDDQAIALPAALLAPGSLEEPGGRTMFAGGRQFFVHQIVFSRFVRSQSFGTHRSPH